MGKRKEVEEEEVVEEGEKDWCSKRRGCMPGLRKGTQWYRGGKLEECIHGNQLTAKASNQFAKRVAENCVLCASEDALPQQNGTEAPAG
ncbi:hypothetical protein EYF80_009134 [Liparis tanakae]|uniref:Uncharacterized protein n=1 Tax=Liparis tanakae TaxID=230148 RepID=A0A4Z2IS17_9TELE|nr:hypothetical protein EYF80_009134 [Liparis tanakae]